MMPRGLFRGHGRRPRTRLGRLRKAVSFMRALGCYWYHVGTTWNQYTLYMLWSHPLHRNGSGIALSEPVSYEHGIGKKQWRRRYCPAWSSTRPFLSEETYGQSKSYNNTYTPQVCVIQRL